MEKIELNSYDKKDLLELLDYACEKKLKEKVPKKVLEKWDEKNYWKMRIEHLKRIINGYTNSGSYIQSSYQTIDTELRPREKQQRRYRESIENDLVDFIDYMDEKKGEELW